LFPGSEEADGALDPYLVDFRSRVIQLAEMGMGDIRGTPECVVVLRVMKVAVERDWENRLLWDKELLSMLGENIFQPGRPG